VEAVMMRLAAVWLLSLIVVAVLASTITAQIDRTQPRVVSGADLGVRIDGTDHRSGRPVGVLVVRVNGEWVEVASEMKASPAQTR
jgi:hypothetical protein